MSPDPWIDDQRLEIGGSRFIASAVALGDTDGCFIIVKPPELVRRYLTVLEAEHPRTIVELGIKDGGSTALIALAAEPDLLLAVDLEAEIPALLADLVETRGLHDRLIMRFGLDQADRAALTGFVDAHLPAGGFDLIIDDASHILGPTRASFEVLFPRLRPGGLYVVEDWCAECVHASQLARLLPPGTDLADRVAAVNQLFHILNSPDHDLPDAVKASMTAAANDGAADTAARDLFERIVEVAGRSDLSGLDAVPIGRTRPLTDLAVELMMIGATNRELVEEVRIDSEWLTVRRGTAAIAPDGFRLAEHWADFFGYLA